MCAVLKKRKEFLNTILDIFIWLCIRLFTCHQHRRKRLQLLGQGILHRTAVSSYIIAELAC